MTQYFTVKDKSHEIKCKLFRGADEAKISTVVLTLHGFAGHKESSAIEKFADRVMAMNGGVAVISFDMPAHGEDRNDILRLSDCDEYISIMLSHVREMYSPERICCYCTSMGGYLALKYIYEHGNPFPRIAIRCPAVCMYDTLMDKVLTPEQRDKLSETGFACSGFDRLVGIDRSFCDELLAFQPTKLDFSAFADDILIIQGTADELLDYGKVKGFAESNSIRFIPSQGSDHRFLDERKMSAAIDSSAEFLGLI